MEGVAEMNWSSFNATVSAEESEFIANLLGPCPFSSEQEQDLSLGISSLFWSEDQVADSYYSSHDANSSFCYWPQENNTSSFNTNIFFAHPSDHQAYYMSEPNVVPAISNNNYGQTNFHVEGTMIVPSNSFGYYACQETSSENVGGSAMNSSELVVAPGQKPEHKRKLSMDEVDKPTRDDNATDTVNENPKKKAKASSQIHKSSKVPKSRKTQMSYACSEEEENNVVALNVRTSSSNNSENDSSASQEPNGGGSTSSAFKGPTALNLNGKTRASRGSATDPQSLYARKRRERINERLRILQNLVPNGTKVDISTMLEEAVEYVKFLQLQIKLLSSEELWMFAPLAYNGMDIGLNLKISPPQQ